MSDTVLIGLTLQVVCLAILWQQFKWKIFQFTGALFVFMTFIYHGLTEIINTAFPGRNEYRDLVSSDAIGSTVLLFSTSICFFLISYLTVLNRKNKPLLFRHEVIDRSTAVLNVNLPILIWSTIACYAIKFYYMLSTGFDDVDVSSSEYWIYGLSTYLFPYLLTITSVALIMLRSKITVQAVLILQILIGVTSVSRMSVLFSIANTMLIVNALGYKFDKRKLYPIVFFTLGVLVLISIARGVSGRYALAEMSPMERVGTIFTSARADDSNIGGHVLDDFVYRSDANAPNALIFESLSSGQEPAGVMPILVDLYLQVPRVLNPVKLDSDILLRNSKAITFAHFGSDPTVDYLQGWLGYFLGCFGRLGMLFAMAVLGVLLAKLDGWLIQTSLSISVLVYYIVISNVLYYEGVLQSLLGSTRSIAAISIVMLIFYNLMRRFSFSIKAT
jgi:hypothetical protein